MFKNQPKGLYILSLANTGERFGYYTMIAVLVLYLQAKFAFDSTISGQIYGIFLAMAYFLPLIGGWIADRWSFSKCVVLGMAIMFAGYLVIALPSGLRSREAMVFLFGGLALVSIGTGLFKGNLQVMIGDLYNATKYASQRDTGFNLFYMFINIGAVFAPITAKVITNFALSSEGLVYNMQLPALCNAFIDGDSSRAQEIISVASAAGMEVGGSVLAFAERYMSALSTGYGYAFAVACVSVVLSYAIFALGKQTYAHIITEKAQGSEKKAEQVKGAELTPEQTRQRIVALLLVFGVVIFFWMVFMQNGATLTLFAAECTAPEAYGATRIGFNIWALCLISIAVFALFGVFQNKTVASRSVSALVLVVCAAGLWWFYATTPNPLTDIQPMEYQQFDPFYIIALTPVSLSLFAWLARSGREPSAPRKIGYGMIVAALAYVVMILASLTCTVENGQVSGSVSPNWLMGTYLMLVFAELLLSPIGISFVTKVAPPKYKGAMMGCWFAATAIGNYLTSIPMMLWGKMSLPLMWGILVGVCLLAALFIFSIMRRLEAVTSEASGEEMVEPTPDGEELLSC
ncbi:MAG: peptide MFS transporter [Bacteroidales bacterium]|nr:peptide MFS transporter [Bacteroidales bacterium]